MSIRDLELYGTEENVTISLADLRTFFSEVVHETTAKQKEAEEAAKGNDTLFSDEVCNELCVTPQTLWRWRKSGYLLPCSQIGKRQLYLRSDIENLKKGGR